MNNMDASSFKTLFCTTLYSFLSDHTEHQLIDLDLINIHIKKEIEKEYELLVTYYNEQQRYYHTLEHIFDCIIEFNDNIDVINESLESVYEHRVPSVDNCDKNNTNKNSKFIYFNKNITYNLVLLCIFYHDIIYDPTSPMNEELSAQLFKRMIDRLYLLYTQLLIKPPKVPNQRDCNVVNKEIGGDMMNSSFTNGIMDYDKISNSNDMSTKDVTLSSPNDIHAYIDIIVFMILKTKHGTSIPMPDSLKCLQLEIIVTHIVDIMLDIDLSILCTKSMAKFKQYEANIRKEYIFVEWGKYQVGRNQVLTMFLRNAQNGQLYNSFYAKKECNEYACINLKWAIETLLKEQNEVDVTHRDTHALIDAPISDASEELPKQNCDSEKRIIDDIYSLL